MEMEEEEKKKSRVLVIGATGSLGQELVKSSLALGHPTFVLIRDQTFNDPQKAHLIQSFSLNAITLLKVSLYISIFLNLSLWLQPIKEGVSSRIKIKILDHTITLTN